MSEFVERRLAQRMAEVMPALLKLVVTGISIDPPTVDAAKAPAAMVQDLDDLVATGVAIVTIDRDMRSYRLTRLGRLIAQIISTQPCPPELSS